MRLPLVLGALLLAAPVLAGDAPQSGPPAGTKMMPFDVVDVTGQFKADPKVCYV